MESLEVDVHSKDPELVKKKRGAIRKGKISIEKSLGRLLARRAGKFDQGKLPRLQVQSKHGSLKFQEEGEIIHEAYYFDGMDGEIEEESPEFPNQEKLNNKADLPDPDLAKNEEERASLKEAPSWQLKEKVALKLQEVDGAEGAGTAV